jgi:hypothetical protein
MTTDFRALCAELLRAWQFGDDIAGPMNRARAELAKPEPAELTDQEVADAFAQGCRDGAINSGQPAFLRGARAAIAADRARCGTPITQPMPVSERYWGRRIAIKRGGVGGSSNQPILPTTQPVPVSERLPEAGDWVWHCYAGVRFWEHGRYNGRQFFIGDGPESQPATHWRPHHALPTPEATNV